MENDTRYVRNTLRRPSSRGVYYREYRGKASYTSLGNKAYRKIRGRSRCQQDGIRLLRRQLVEAMSESKAGRKSGDLEMNNGIVSNKDSTGSNSSWVETDAVQGQSRSRPQQTPVVVDERVVVSSNPHVRNNSKVQCCYPVRGWVGIHCHSRDWYLHPSTPSTTRRCPCQIDAS